VTSVSGLAVAAPFEMSLLEAEMNGYDVAITHNVEFH
jgi:hypothetical protein